jgi:hypothetical protein
MLTLPSTIPLPAARVRAQTEAAGFSDSPAPSAALAPVDFPLPPEHDDGTDDSFDTAPRLLSAPPVPCLARVPGLEGVAETRLGIISNAPQPGPTAPGADCPDADPGLDQIRPGASPRPPKLRRKDAAEHARRVGAVTRWLQLRAEGVTLSAAAAMLRLSTPTLCRWAQVYERHGEAALAPGWQNCGRSPDHTPTEYELAEVRSVYVRLSESRVRGRGRGSSKVTAFRLVAASEDPRVTEQFRQVVLRRNSRTLPPSWERLLDTPSSVLAHQRDHSSPISAYISTPRGLHFVDAAGVEKPLRAGSLFESDDGTVNFPVVVPWPYGGDPCSDKFGVKVGRFQLLPIVDVRTRFCPFWQFVIRSKGSYRGEDIVALFGATFSEVGMPEALRLERGSWESNIVRDALQLAGVPSVPAWHSKQKNAVENFFDRLWTPLSLAPGDVGRFRGENAENTALLAQCEAGRRDPREHFLTVEQAAEQIGRSVAFINSEPVECRAWGRWVPQALFASQTAEQPLPILHQNLRVFFARECREWTVRKGAVGGTVETPSLRFPVWFQHESLWEFEGCRVRCHFDPFEPDVRGTIVLLDAWRSYQPGHVIAVGVSALDLPPQAVLAADWKDDDATRSLATRKAMAKAVRTESWSWRGGRRSEARDGFGNTAVVTDGVRPASGIAPAPGWQTPPRPRRPVTPAPDTARPRPRGGATLEDLRELDPAPAQGRSSSGYAVSMNELRELLE